MAKKIKASKLSGKKASHSHSLAANRTIMQSNIHLAPGSAACHGEQPNCSGPLETKPPK